MESSVAFSADFSLVGNTGIRDTGKLVIGKLEIFETGLAFSIKVVNAIWNVFIASKLGVRKMIVELAAQAFASALRGTEWNDEVACVGSQRKNEVLITLAAGIVSVFDTISNFGHTLEFRVREDKLSLADNTGLVKVDQAVVDVFRASQRIEVQMISGFTGQAFKAIQTEFGTVSGIEARLSIRRQP